MRAGDVLLLEGHHAFVQQQRDSRDFFLVSELDNTRPPRHERAWLATAVVLSMVLAAAIGWLSMLQAALLAAGVLILTRCTNGAIARRAVDWEVLVVIGASFGIATALQTTGAAQALAEQLIGLAGGVAWAALALVFVATTLLTSVVTNNAPAALMFPIAAATAQHMQVAVLPFAVTALVAASAGYAAPIGYQTNLMVYGPGGYYFADYLRAGIPLTVLVGVLTVFLVPLFWAL